MHRVTKFLDWILKLVYSMHNAFTLTVCKIHAPKCGTILHYDALNLSHLLGIAFPADVRFMMVSVLIFRVFDWDLWWELYEPCDEPRTNWFSIEFNGFTEQPKCHDKWFWT